jgi:outer membrane protein
MKRGIGTAIEAAQARQATAQARLVMVQATGAAQNAYYLTLIYAMGISPLTQIKVADVSDRRLSPELAGSAEKIISVGLARRPDILAAYAAQKASLANVRAAEAEFFPKLFLAGTGSYNNGTLSVSGVPSIANVPSILNLSPKGFGATIQQARRQDFGRGERVVLAARDDGRLPCFLLLHQGFLRNRHHRRPQEVRCTDVDPPWR